MDPMEHFQEKTCSRAPGRWERFSSMAAEKSDAGME